MEEIIIGATLIFKEDNAESVSGILKSLVMTSTKNDLINDVNKWASEISQFYGYEFIGINDFFFVSGEIKQGQMLGRTTYYNLNTINKSKSLVPDEFSFDSSSESKNFNCSLVYFCKNLNKEKFTISVITLLNSTASLVVDAADNIANKISFKEIIKTTSIDNIDSLNYIGINDIGETDLKFGVFQSLYSEFYDDSNLIAEIITTHDMILKLEEILN